MFRFKRRRRVAVKRSGSRTTPDAMVASHPLAGRCKTSGGRARGIERMAEKRCLKTSDTSRRD